MGKRISGIGLAVVIAFTPAVVLARGPCNAPTVGVDGVMYNTNSPEWRQAGGNLEVYQQIMAQKYLIQQQQMMMKQQQAYMQMQKKLAAQNKASGTNTSRREFGGRHSALSNVDAEEEEASNLRPHSPCNFGNAEVRPDDHARCRHGDHALALMTSFGAVGSQKTPAAPPCGPSGSLCWNPSHWVGWAPPTFLNPCNDRRSDGGRCPPSPARRLKPRPMRAVGR